MTTEEIAREIGNAPITAIATGLLKRLEEKVRQTPTEPSEKEWRKLFGARLRMIRNLRGLTQADVAKHLGINKSMVTHYENGRSEPPLRKLIQLAELLDVSTDWLLDVQIPNNK